MVRFLARIVGVMVAVGGIILSSCAKSDEAAVQELVIISPNGSDIRREFEWGFTQWHERKYGTKVHISWPDIGGGGTQNISRTLDGQYKNGNSSSYDLAFGGGSASFEFYRDRGYLVKPGLEDAVLAQVPADIFGTKLHGAGDAWIAATMANFGINYNKDRIRELGLETPRTWEDIAGTKWIGNLSLADPSKSGSVLSSYEQIFLQYGWE